MSIMTGLPLHECETYTVKVYWTVKFSGILHHALLTNEQSVALSKQNHSPQVKKLG